MLIQTILNMDLANVPINDVVIFKLSKRLFTMYI